MKINLEEFMDGAVSDSFNAAFREVLKNIQDPNSKDGAKRKISLNVFIAPNSERDVLKIEFETNVRLAPLKRMETTMIQKGNTNTGEAEFVERKKEIPGQIKMQTEGAYVKGFDPSTGEIFDLPGTSQEG